MSYGYLRSRIRKQHRSVSAKAPGLPILTAARIASDLPRRRLKGSNPCLQPPDRCRGFYGNVNNNWRDMRLNIRGSAVTSLAHISLYTQQSRGSRGETLVGQ